MKTAKIQEVIDIIKTLPVTDSVTSHEYIALSDAEKVFKEVINARLKHCLGQLKAHAKEAVYVDNHDVIVWNGGHFCIPVYEALLEAQEQGINEWNPLVWQQIVRQMAIEKADLIYFNLATEFLLCSPMVE